MTWITDRLPTFADTDRSGVVHVMRHNRPDDDPIALHWSQISRGCPWRPVAPATPASEPQPHRGVRQALSHEGRLYVVCLDGTWWEYAGSPSSPGSFMQMPVPVPGTGGSGE